MKVAFFLIVTILGALGATAAAWIGAQPAILAGSLALSMLGFAGACAAAALELNAPSTLEEPRIARGPTNPPPLPTADISRRVFGRLWFAAAGALAIFGLVPVIAIARKPGRRVRTGWQTGLRLVDENNAPISRDRLEFGGIETVFPQNGVDIPEGAAVLIRVEPELLHEPSSSVATPDGYVAFSKVCTHAGCPVALYRHASHELYCPCHQSTFDVLNGAKNLSGPAPRPLPQLQLDVDAEGYLIARGDFAGPVGPDDWDRIV